ncbi:MAG: winged helix-turn-helix domain-containing protein [Streptosporangiaceae bacterium]
MEFKPGTSKRNQVAEHMRGLIESGEWQPGSIVKGVFELADEFGCSMEVVRQAEHMLADQGYLNRPRQGLWTRVAGVPKKTAAELLAEVMETHDALGRQLAALGGALT